MSHSSTLKVEEADSSKAWYLLTKLHHELITTNQNLKVHCHENLVSHILTKMLNLSLILTYFRSSLPYFLPA
jgi:hypothetical protein